MHLGPADPRQNRLGSFAGCRLLAGAPPNTLSHSAHHSARRPVSELYTVGHSNRSEETFLDLLSEHGIERLVDVRRFPGSKRHPQFNQGVLREALAEHDVHYRHLEALGGYRDSRPDSPNTAWKREGFRAYADHLNSEAGQNALCRLNEWAEAERTAVMCAEAVPWRCHRQLIADAFTARDWTVIHVLDENRTEVHELRREAVALEDGRVIYPGPDVRQGELFD